MKRKIMSRIMLILLLISTSTLAFNIEQVSAVDSPYVAVIPASIEDDTLTPGNTFTVSIYTDYTGSDVWAYQFSLSYNPSVIQGVSVTNGDLITGVYAQFIPGTFDNTAGTLSLTTAFDIYLYTTSGPGTLANVTFEVVGVGTSNITLETETQLKAPTYNIIDIFTHYPPHIGHGYFNNEGGAEVHDVHVVEVIAQPNQTIAASNVSINVELRNEGTEEESVNVTISYDTTLIGFNDTVVLPAGNSLIVSFSWETPTVPENTTYTITAEVPPVTGEVDTTDNNATTQIKLVALHDVSVENGVVAPSIVFVGAMVFINVTVTNEGSFDENVTLTLKYTANVTENIYTKNFILAALRNNTVSFNWDTTDLIVGDCTITAEAVLAGDADLTDNHASTTVIVAPGALNPVPPGYYETSEYLIGSVAVGVILPESNGTIDPSTEDWTSAEESQVVSEIMAGLDWWAAYNPSAGVSFSVEVHYRVPTSYEPISRSSWGGDEKLWVSDIMTSLGYLGTDFLNQVRDYINDLRDRLGTNWAFAIFVVDSSNDLDGNFPDGYYAGALGGGPLVVMSYDLGFLGIGMMDIITAHEMGHIFWATDEYDFIREYSGYLNVSDNDGAYCLMNWDVWKLCDASREQIGWRDTDGDGILDIVDTVPNTTLNPYLPDPTSNTTLTYTGSVTVAAYPNRNPDPWGGYERRNITINTITNVEYRIDNGPWVNATATDGAFDETQETFSFNTPLLSGGVHTIEVRGTNSVGNVEKTYASDVVTISLPTVAATVDIHPHALNLRSRGRWITVRIELPEGYDVSDIDVSTVMLNGEIQAELHPTEIGDYDSDGIPDLMVKFNRTALTAHIYHVSGITYGDVTLTITGQLTDGTTFEGSDTIKVMFGGDADLSGFIELTDFQIWANNYGKYSGEWSSDVNPDFDSNDFVELADFLIWIENFGATVPPPP